MLTITGTGRVTAELSPQKSAKTGVDYLRFSIEVNKGYGEKQKAVFLQCSLIGEQQVQRMVNAKVKKGSLISFTGDFDVEEYEKNGAKEKSVKVMLYDWSYTPSSGQQKSDTAQPLNQYDSSSGDAVSSDYDDDMPF